MVTRAAFSLIETLVVLAIIAVLSGLVVAGAKALGIGSKATKTASILAVVRTGLELASANQGSRPSPVEHPLAASCQPRPAFSRRSGSPVLAPCESAGMALRGIPADLVSTALTAGHGRVLLDDDRFADPAAPQFFGVERGRMGILGAGAAVVTAYRKLPPSFTGDPDASSRIGILVAPTGTMQDGGSVIDQVFSAAGTRSELVALGGIRAVPSAFVHPITSAPVHGRLVSDVPSSAQGQERFKPGMVRDDVRGWKAYALPGSVLVDAWGREILYSQTDNGSIVLESAGRDGCFRFAPGEDGILDTADATAMQPAAGDLDATRDNLVSRPGM